MNSAHPQMSGSRVLAAYLGDIRFELVKMLRNPMFAIPTLLFPLLFFVLFGIFMGSARGNLEMARYFYTSYTVFGAMAPGLFGFGVSLAVEREQGMLYFRQAIPTPPGSFLVSRMVMAMIFVSIVALCMMALALFVAHVPLTAKQCVTVFVVNVLGVLPFCAIGLFIGALASGQAAPAIVNLIFLPLAFLSGLWFPLPLLGDTLQQLGPLWPPFHLLQLSLQATDRPYLGTTANHVGALLGVTVIFFFLALRRLGGSGVKLFGNARSGFGFPLRRAIGVGLLSISAGLVIAGVMGGNTPRAAASPVATSTDDTEDDNASAATEAAPSMPIGVAAPDTEVIADFDHGSADASYGLGFGSEDDKERGGNSSISQQLIAGGAQNTSGALEVTGEVGTALPYPFVGTSFLPNAIAGTEWLKMGYMDYSAKHTLSFFARGEDQTYTVLFLGPVLDGFPPIYQFKAGAEWTEVRVPLANVGGLDLKRVKLISIGSNVPGPFRIAIDNVRVE